MEDEARLISEQLRHMVDVFDARLERIELNREHLLGRWWEVRSGQWKVVSEEKVRLSI